MSNSTHTRANSGWSTARFGARPGVDDIDTSATVTVIRPVSPGLHRAQPVPVPAGCHRPEVQEYALGVGVPEPQLDRADWAGDNGPHPQVAGIPADSDHAGADRTGADGVRIRLLGGLAVTDDSGQRVTTADDLPRRARQVLGVLAARYDRVQSKDAL